MWRSTKSTMIQPIIVTSLSSMTLLKSSFSPASVLRQRKVPRAFFDYAEAGSYSQQTLRANRADLERIALRQRVLVDVSDLDITTTLLGQKLASPVFLAPVGGFLGMAHPEGAIPVARAAVALAHTTVRRHYRVVSWLLRRLLPRALCTTAAN